MYIFLLRISITIVSYHYVCCLIKITTRQQNTLVSWDSVPLKFWMGQVHFGVRTSNITFLCSNVERTDNTYLRIIIITTNIILYYLPSSPIGVSNIKYNNTRPSTVMPSCGLGPLIMVFAAKTVHDSRQYYINNIFLYTGTRRVLKSNEFFPFHDSRDSVAVNYMCVCVTCSTHTL